MPQSTRAHSPFKAQFQAHHFLDLFEANDKLERTGKYSSDRHLKYGTRKDPNLIPCSDAENHARNNDDFTEVAEDNAASGPPKKSGFNPDLNLEYLEL